MNTGLTSDEAAALLRKHGWNELPAGGRKNILQIGRESVKEPMFLLLIGCAVLYMLLGDYREGFIMLSSTLLIISIAFYQYRKTERALEALRGMSSPRALVLRDGREVRIPGREVVPGDILLVHEGDRVAADALLLEAFSLKADESLLTGESFPVDKTPATGSLNENEGKLYSGSLIVQGRGMARVLETGVHTLFGQIGLSLRDIPDRETQLQKEMKILIRNLFIGGLLISIGVVTAFYLTRGSFIHALLNGLAASMAILPEEFPVVFTVFMALGAWRLSRNKVLTRKPSAIETLGSATVLCADKTGTITENRMQVAAFAHAGGIEACLSESLSDISAKLVRKAALASYEQSFDPIDRAIHQLAEQNPSFAETANLKIIKEYPLSKELPVMTRVLATENSKMLDVYSKGAPEFVFGLCDRQDPALQSAKEHLKQLAGQGYRVLAVAEGQWQDEYLPDKQTGFALKLTGLVAMEDPVRKEVPAALKECSDAGILVTMITGDYPDTARAIATRAGMQSGKLMSGDELKETSDEELVRVIRDIRIFARVVPEQKLRIVRALQQCGEVVAMTGDGVNDAPALRAADIGIAMGNKGTDVAREASSLVLTDDNFASIVQAIRSGRKIYDNLQKAMSYIMAIHIPIIGLTLIPAMFTGIPVLLMPLHIIFMELIIDPVCSIAFENEEEEPDIMQRPPRISGKAFFGAGSVMYSLLKGMMLLLTVLLVYLITAAQGHTETEIRAITFTSLITGNVFLILSSLSNNRGILYVLKEKNISLIVILTTAFLLLACTLFIPDVRMIFGFSDPGSLHFLDAILASGIMLLVLEGIKFARKLLFPVSRKQILPEQ